MEPTFKQRPHCRRWLIGDCFQPRDVDNTCMACELELGADFSNAGSGLQRDCGRELRWTELLTRCMEVGSRLAKILQAYAAV
jgi:hypothetical protein